MALESPQENTTELLKKQLAVLGELYRSQHRQAQEQKLLLEQLDASVTSLSTEMRAMRESTASRGNQALISTVRVADFGISFGSVLALIIKWVCASFLVGIVLVPLWLIVAAVLGSLLY